MELVACLEERHVSRERSVGPDQGLRTVAGTGTALGFTPRVRVGYTEPASGIGHGNDNRQSVLGYPQEPFWGGFAFRTQRTPPKIPS